jgi:hypothetical protein
MILFPGRQKSHTHIWVFLLLWASFFLLMNLLLNILFMVLFLSFLNVGKIFFFLIHHYSYIYHRTWKPFLLDQMMFNKITKNAFKSLNDIQKNYNEMKTMRIQNRVI